MKRMNILYPLGYSLVLSSSVFTSMHMNMHAINSVDECLAEFH
jgi:hypothetical protein